MSKKFDSVLASPMGNFVRSPLGVRDAGGVTEFGYMFDEFSPFRYDAASDSWSNIASDPLDRAGVAGVFGVARSGGDILGYRHGSRVTSVPVAVQFKQMTEYTSSTDSWRAVHRTLFSHNAPASSSLPGQGFTWGGAGLGPDDPARREVEVYFPDSDTWSARPDGQSRQEHRATPIESRYYITGGLNRRIYAGGTVDDDHRFYDDALRAFRVLQPMARARTSHIALSPIASLPNEGVEYVIAGLRGASGSDLFMTDDASRYNIADDTWTTLTPYPLALYGAGGFALSDGLYTCGGLGRTGPSTFVHHDDVFRFSDGAWVRRQSYPRRGTIFDQGVKL